MSAPEPVADRRPCGPYRRPPEVLRHNESETAAAGTPPEEPLLPLSLSGLADRTGLRVAGHIDLSAREVWADALRRLEEMPGDICIDLSDVSFIDVGGATLLAQTALRLSAGRRLVLRRPPLVLASMLDLLWGPLPTIEMEET